MHRGGGRGGGGRGGGRDDGGGGGGRGGGRGGLGFRSNPAAGKRTTSAYPTGGQPRVRGGGGGSSSGGSEGASPRDRGRGGGGRGRSFGEFNNTRYGAEAQQDAGGSRGSGGGRGGRRDSRGRGGPYRQAADDEDDDDDGDMVGADAAPPQQHAAASSAATVPSAILAIGQGGTTVVISGTSSLRYAVVCSILSNKPITFRLKAPAGQNVPQGWKARDQEEGIPKEAISFLRLISQVTTGTQVSLSQSGDELRFVPGLITASGSIVHEYNPPVDADAGEAARSLAYFIEPLLLILPFSRRAVSLTLVGPSHGPHDVCPHTLRTVTLRIAQAFGIEASLRIVRHSGKVAGCVILQVQPARKLKCATLTDFGLVSRVRGIAYGTDVSPDLPQRASISAKGVLLNFLPDVYVVTDVSSSRKNAATDGRTPTLAARTSAFGIMLVAETTSKRAVVSQESTADFREDADIVGQRAAKLLLDEIATAACVDRHHQPLTLMLMALAPDDVSTVRFGQLAPAALSTIDLMAQFLSVRPVIKDVAAEGAAAAGCVVSCFGSATINLTKRSG